MWGLNVILVSRVTPDYLAFEALGMGWLKILIAGMEPGEWPNSRRETSSGVGRAIPIERYG